MSSFSLPSASGVVSLLNDAKPTKGTAVPKDDRPASRPSLSHHDSGSTSSINSQNSATFSNSIGGVEGGNGSTASVGSLASSLTSLTDSSTESLSSIKALRQRLKAQSQKASKRDGTDAVEESNSISPSDRSSMSKDDPEQEAEKRRKLNGGQWQSPPRHQSQSDHHNDNILHQPRMAASPQPINSHGPSQEVEAELPLNMHKAVSLSEKESSQSGHHNTTSKGYASERGTGSPSSGKRRYPCSHPGCGKTFSTSGHAARHNRIHTGE